MPGGSEDSRVHLCRQKQLKLAVWQVCLCKQKKVALWIPVGCTESLNEDNCTLLYVYKAEQIFKVHNLLLCPYVNLPSL